MSVIISELFIQDENSTSPRTGGEKRILKIMNRKKENLLIIYSSTYRQIYPPAVLFLP